MYRFLCSKLLYVLKEIKTISTYVKNKFNLNNLSLVIKGGLLSYSLIEKLIGTKYFQLYPSVSLTKLNLIRLIYIIFYNILYLTQQ